MNIPGASDGVYYCLPACTHILALPKNCTLFAGATASENIFVQEIIRWAALGGQQVAYEYN